MGYSKTDILISLMRILKIILDKKNDSRKQILRDQQFKFIRHIYPWKEEEYCKTPYNERSIISVDVCINVWVKQNR